MPGTFVISAKDIKDTKKRLRSKNKKKKPRIPKASKKVDIAQNAVLKSIKKDVRMLKGETEIKQASFQSSNAYGMGYITSGDSASSSAPSCMTPGRLIEDVGSGYEGFDRVGSKINIKSWYQKIRFQVKQSQFGSGAYAYPVDARIIIARCKSQSVPTSTTAPSFSIFNTLFRYDTASAYATSPPNNDFLRYNLPINTADWQVVYDKKHRLLPLTLVATTGLSTATTEKWSMMAGVKSHVDITFNCKKHIGKVMKWTTGAQPDNYKQFFVFHLAVPAGHDTAWKNTTAGVSFLEYQFIERLKYTDS
jgi:hypothetical protein